MSANHFYTPAEIKQMREEGVTLNKAFKDTAKGVEPRRVSIVDCDEPSGSSGQQWGTAPRITAPGAGEKVTGISKLKGDDGEVVVQQKVLAPNTSKFNQQAASRKLKEIEIAEAAKAEQSQLDPVSLHSTLQAQARIIKRLEKQLNTLTKELKNNA